MEYKSPTDVLDFTVDWTNELNSATISTTAWVVGSGLTNDSDTNNTTTTTITLSGGTAGKTYDLKNIITTSATKTFANHFSMRVKDQLVG